MPTITQPRRVNVRTPEVMPLVQAEVESHYRSNVVERIRAAGGTLTVGNTTVKLARQFGFCYGVERAIDLAYAARKVFADRHLFLLGEIIHNPEVNRQLREMDIKVMPSRPSDEELARVSRASAGLFGPGVELRLSFVDRIEWGATGKLRPFRSHVNSEYDAIDWDAVSDSAEAG